MTSKMDVFEHHANLIQDAINTLEGALKAADKEGFSMSCQFPYKINLTVSEAPLRKPSKGIIYSKMLMTVLDLSGLKDI